MSNLVETGEAGFLAGLRRYGCEPQTRYGIIVFMVVLVSGRYAGQIIETGVTVEELTGWPSAPPHWVHLPAIVTIAKTNSKASPIPGWLMHSRNISNWGNAKEPAQAWLAHVRAVLEEP